MRINAGIQCEIKCWQKELGEINIFCELKAYSYQVLYLYASRKFNKFQY